MSNCLSPSPIVHQQCSDPSRRKKTVGGFQIMWLKGSQSICAETWFLVGTHIVNANNKYGFTQMWHLGSECKVCMMNHFDDTQWKTLLIPSFWPSRARTVHPGTWHCTPRPFGGPFFEGRHTPPVWEHPLLQQHHDPHRPPPHVLLHLSIHRYLSLHQGGSIITNTS